MRLSVPFCLFDRHSPIRSGVTWDGLNYVGTCRHCDSAIRRKSHRVWTRDWMEGGAVKPP